MSVYLGLRNKGNEGNQLRLDSEKISTATNQADILVMKVRNFISKNLDSLCSDGHRFSPRQNASYIRLKPEMEKLSGELTSQISEIKKFEQKFEAVASHKKTLAVLITQKEELENIDQEISLLSFLLLSRKYGLQEAQAFAQLEDRGLLLEVNLEKNITSLKTIHFHENCERLTEFTKLQTDLLKLFEVVKFNLEQAQILQSELCTPRRKEKLSRFSFNRKPKRKKRKMLPALEKAAIEKATQIELTLPSSRFTSLKPVSEQHLSRLEYPVLKLDLCGAKYEVNTKALATKRKRVFRSILDHGMIACFKKIEGNESAKAFFKEIFKEVAKGKECLGKDFSIDDPSFYVVFKYKEKIYEVYPHKLLTFCKKTYTCALVLGCHKVLENDKYKALKEALEQEKYLKKMESPKPLQEVPSTSSSSGQTVSVYSSRFFQSTFTGHYPYGYMPVFNSALYPDFFHPFIYLGPYGNQQSYCSVTHRQIYNPFEQGNTAKYDPYGLNT